MCCLYFFTLRLWKPVLFYLIQMKMKSPRTINPQKQNSRFQVQWVIRDLERQHSSLKNLKVLFQEQGIGNQKVKISFNSETCILHCFQLHSNQEAFTVPKW